MITSDNSHVLDSLVLTRDLELPGERSAFFAHVRLGRYTTVLRGAYVPAAVWSQFDALHRHLARIVAATALSSDARLVFSHDSAAALWRLPFIDSPSARLHVVSPPAAGGRSNSTIARHTVGIPETVVEIDGIAVTSLARTVVDLAATRAMPAAVSFADAALRRTLHPRAGVPATGLTTNDLRRELNGLARAHGSAKARRVVEFADGRADRPGESISRVSMRTARITPPEIQVALAGASGRMWTVDFFWRIFNMIGEFDGKAKYSDPTYLNGRTAEQAVYDEKVREDDLRAANHGFTRWPWATALSPALLRAHLARAGVR